MALVNLGFETQRRRVKQWDAPQRRNGTKVDLGMILEKKQILGQIVFYLILFFFAFQKRQKCVPLNGLNNGTARPAD